MHYLGTAANTYIHVYIVSNMTMLFDLRCKQVTNVFEPFTAPPALTVTITNNTESPSVVVQWDEVDDFLYTIYAVTWTSERDLNNVQIENVEEQPSYTITGLTLDTVYTITVTATNRCGSGPEYSTSVSISTGTMYFNYLCTVCIYINPTIVVSMTIVFIAKLVEKLRKVLTKCMLV